MRFSCVVLGVWLFVGKASLGGFMCTLVVVVVVVLGGGDCGGELARTVVTPTGACGLGGVLVVSPLEWRLFVWYTSQPR